MSLHLQQGDKIRVPKDFLIGHVGIFVGNVIVDGVLVRNGVIHNSKTHGSVVAETLEIFAAGGEVRILERARLGTERVVAERALALLGRRYDLGKFNCEHAANLAQTGIAMSPQLNGWKVVAGAAAIGGLYGLASFFLAQRPTYDARVGVLRSPKTGRFVSS